MRDEIIKQLEKQKVIAIIRGVKPEKSLKVAKALYEGGTQMIEVTFDQKDEEEQKGTAESIRQIVEYFQGKVSVGAGTVTSAKQVEMAAEAGASTLSPWIHLKQ